MACEEVITNVPPVGQARPASSHQGGGFVRVAACGSWDFWTRDVNANCHGIYGLKSINCIPMIDFLTTPLQVDVDANGHIIYNVGKIFIGSSSDDGSGALLQVAGEINAQSYMVDGVEFASPSVSPPGEINLENIYSINNIPVADYLPGGATGSIQFNEGGFFAGDNFLIYDPITHNVGIVPQGLGPQWRLDVGGDINIIDPTYTGRAYRINGIPFAVADSSGSHINLINIGLINGAPPGSGGGGGASPGGVQGNVQFNSGGLFAGSNNLFWDNTNNRLGIGTAAPQYPLDVVGNENISGCYFIAHVPFACADGSGISLQNITTINGGPIGGSGGTPAAPNTSVQFNNNGAFGGSSNLTWDNTNRRLGVGVPPQFNVDVAGIVNATQCYYVAGVSFACSNGSGGINLTNITNINGAPPGSGGASVSVGVNPPANPALGNLWFDAADTQLYIWYTDATSSQWVSTINQCGLIGDAPSDGQTYGRSDGQWVVTGGGGSGGQNQTPWLSDIQAMGFQLLGASTVSFLFGSTSGSIFASGAGSLQFIGNGNTPLWIRSPSWLQLDSVNSIFNATTTASTPAFQFNTSGITNALVILPAFGQVGIGTANPTSLLHISGAASSFNAVITLESTGSDFVQMIRGAQTWWMGTGILSPASNWTLLNQTTNTPVISAMPIGYVGIGNPSPLGELFVSTANTTNAMRGITSFQASNGLSGAIITLAKSRGTVAVPATVQVGDYLGALSFSGWVSNGNFTGGVVLQAPVTAVTASTIATDLTFNNAIGEAMRLTSAGHLGILTSAPDKELTVNGQIHAEMGTNAFTGVWYDSSVGSSRWFLGTDSTDIFRLYSAGSSVGNCLVVTGTGNVGIGTSTPSSLLHVYGGASNADVNIQSANAVRMLFTSGGAAQLALWQNYYVANAFGIHDVGSNTNPLVILSNGNVGIQTTNPVGALDVGPDTSVFSLLSCTCLGGHNQTAYNACLTVQSDRGLPGAPPTNTMTFTFGTASKILTIYITDAGGVQHSANITMS